MKKFIIPLLILFLTSCNPWKFLGDYDKEVNFSTYKTFGLLSWDPHNDKEVTPQTKNYILMAIKNELELRGYIYQKDNAELQISIFVIVTEATSYSAYANHYAGYSGGYYSSVSVGVGVGSGGTSVGVVGYGMPNMYPYTTVKHDYNVGTVVVDMWDISKNRIVWQGVATGRLGREAATESAVNRDVGRLFQTLPVKKVKK